jgi:quercetin dioxygenase-like cupin family protein
VIVLEGALCLTIEGKLTAAVPGTIVRMPANVPCGSGARPTRMLLIMLGDAAEPKNSEAITESCPRPHDPVESFAEPHHTLGPDYHST